MPNSESEATAPGWPEIEDKLFRLAPAVVEKLERLMANHDERIALKAIRLYFDALDRHRLGFQLQCLEEADEQRDA